MNDQQPGNTQELRDVLPESASPDRKGAGGTHTHKQGCLCRPCKARAREQKALPVPTGAGGADGVGAVAQGVIAADELSLTSGKRTKERYRAIIAEWIKARTIDSSISNVEVAAKLNISPRTLHRVITQAVKEGWLIFDDPLARIEHEIVPKALDTISSHLDARDKKTAIEVFKSTAAKTYQDSKGVGQAGTNIAIALKIEMPSNLPEGHGQVIEGQIIGQPKVQIKE